MLAYITYTFCYRY